jgi:hypothetical protein
MRSALLRMFLVWTLLLAAGCSNYDRRWKAAQATAPAGDPFAGSYAGAWRSNQFHGAAGKLWCILSRKDQNTYLAEFRATWHGLFSSEHTATLHVTEWQGRGSSRRARFEGAAAIKMWIGSGRYRCEGELKAGALEAAYDASYDRGQFTLRRVAGDSSPRE